MSPALLAALALDPTVADLSWMSGYWLSCEDGREVSETWSDPRGDLMVGHGVTLSRGRSSFELFRIAPHEGGVAYFAQPSGGPATIFAAAEVGSDHVVFVNPEHDFPQRVSYRLEGDVLNARIDGQIDGQPQAMEWRYRRAELNARCPA
ncbi:DUF6265 family protein [Brevundimonas sp. Root1279]|uniref:DUF6265 family protein n=1 Tax=Brevundimonas sp. Root1279 TaxID=1736443 RepID=UPI000701877D|nr:DUF6265 family protein [Brevundimonas sp. Root1279]KQW86613.1 hypothetical protein ASC65_01590 [Brevundimonas sp. Root1279]